MTNSSDGQGQSKLAGDENVRDAAISGDANQAGESLLAANANGNPLVGLVGSTEGFPYAEGGFPADAELTFDPEPEKSRLDLADVLTGTPASDNIHSYLMAISHGDFSTLLVDTDGGGNFTNPDLVLEISGVDWDSGTAGQLADLVNDSIILVI